MEGRVALVTGAASGIGAAVAELLALGGARLVLADVDADRGEKLAERVGGRFVRCDVGEPADWERLVELCVRDAGMPDLAHLNAGIMSVRPDEPFLPIERLPLESYRRILRVNLDGVFLGLRALIPGMRARGGAITVTSSLAGLIPVPDDPVYAATKHALVGLVRSLAGALAATSLRINAICPGAVETAITPEAMKTDRMPRMPARELALEVVDLLLRGASGEIGVKAKQGSPAFSVPPDRSGSLIHSRERSTARCQPASRSARCRGSSCGSKLRSSRWFARIASLPDQTPAARPARNAAPSAVVSSTSGR